MEDRYLYKAKTTPKEKGEFNNVWVTGNLIVSNGKYYIHPVGNVVNVKNEIGRIIVMHEVIPDTICRCTGLKDRNGKLIWENDILMCHGNSEDLVKAVFGEFNVINAETLEVIDRVIGWHYEVVPKDALSKCEPFCFPMPLTEEYVKTCKMKVVDNPELLESEVIQSELYKGKC